MRVRSLSAAIALIALAFSSLIAVPAVSAAPADGATTAPAAGSLDRFYHQKIAWRKCGALQCGTVTVPLDYANPDGQTIKIAVNRYLSAGRGAPNLLVNPGGPGGSGLDFMRGTTRTLVTPAVRRAYNTVGFDPRGLGKSTPVDCHMPESTVDDGTPDTPEEVQAAAADIDASVAACAKNAPDMIAHIGTENVARDMDVIRAALGDRKLSYLGISYGTYIGQVYGHLFPNNVERMVLDGVESATLTIPELIAAQANGFQNALRDWAEGCPRREVCSNYLYGDTPDKLIDFVTGTVSRLDAHPLTAVGKDPITQSDFLNMIQMGLTVGSSGHGWEFIDKVMYEIQTRNGKELARMRELISDGNDENSSTVNIAVQCFDRPVTGTTSDSVQAATDLAKTAPTFGEAFGWAAQPCFTWPVNQNQPAPLVTPNTAAPVLLIGGLHDPNTPYAQAQAAVPLFPSGRLLTWDGTGHSAVARRIKCVDNTVANYLLHGRLPAVGAVCHSA